MPSRPRHRGPHPNDTRLFGESMLPRLRAAAGDLSWLYSRGYAEKAALKLVGDHYQLALRQRMALQRTACSDDALMQRQRKLVSPQAVSGEIIAIDGYNLLITFECALSGGVLLRGRDGCLRDLASLHGSYRSVEETLPAIQHLGAALMRLGPAEARWYFDAPVSNSGRLRALVSAEAERHGWPWAVELVPNPDPVLSAGEAIAVTSDSVILDRAMRWANLAAWVIEGLDPPPRILELA